MGASAAAVRPGTPAPAPAPHLVDAHLLPAVDGAGLRPDLRAIRAARPLLDRLDRSERSAFVAVVTYGGGLATHEARALSETLAGVLALGGGLALPSADGLFGALHLGGALLRGLPGEHVLLVGADPTAAAFLLARGGGAACLPLPPTRISAAGGDAASACGAALATCLARGGLRGREVRRVEAADAAQVEAASVARGAGLSHALATRRATFGASAAAEALLADATLAPPTDATVLWRRRDDMIEACVVGDL